MIPKPVKRTVIFWELLASKYAPNHNVNPKKNRFVIKEIVIGMMGRILHHVAYHYSKATLLGMPDCHTEIDDLIAEDDKVVARITMTASPTECTNCGNEAEVGTLLAFTRGPGVVLRCSACENVVIRITQTPDAIYLDARGAVYLRLARSAG